MEYSDGTVCSREELIVFGDRVFGAEVQPGGFAALLPKLAGEHGIAPEHYRVIREGGQLRAMLLTLPLTLRLGGSELRLRCIGSVSVAAEARGKGLMQLLLTRAQEEMRAEGNTIGALGGQRQRYGYFGFEPAGLELRCTLTAKNVAHAYQDIAAGGLRVSPMGPDSPDMEAAFALSDARRIGVIRERAQFGNLLCSWRSEPYSIRMGDSFAGYLSLCRENEGRTVLVRELCLAEGAALPAVYRACMEQLGAEEMRFTPPLYDRPQLEELCNICEGYVLGCNHSFWMPELVPAVRALLECKAEYSYLTDGEILFDVEGERFQVRVKQGIPEAEHAAHSTGRAVCLTRRQATQWFFSPLGATLEFPGSQAVPRDWFPLPLFLPPPDAC